MCSARLGTRGESAADWEMGWRACMGARTKQVDCSGRCGHCQRVQAVRCRVRKQTPRTSAAFASLAFKAWEHTAAGSTPGAKGRKGEVAGKFAVGSGTTCCAYTARLHLFVCGTRPPSMHCHATRHLGGSRQRSAAKCPQRASHGRTTRGWPRLDTTSAMLLD